jgi:hypothetical protein
LQNVLIYRIFGEDEQDAYLCGRKNKRIAREDKSFAARLAEIRRIAAAL